jgi:protein TonB
MPAKAYEVTEVDVKPALLRQVPPVYPEEAKRQGLEDVIVIRVLITESGELADARIARRAQRDPSFEQAALAAVRQWSFKAAEKRGKPVACWLSVGVPFVLRR